MTFREKLKMEHPECVGKRFFGGAKGCPVHYKYEQKKDERICRKANCKKCWNRKIPEDENAESRRKEKIEELNTWCENSKCEECPICDLLDFEEVCEFEENHEKQLDKFLEAIHAAEKNTEPKTPVIKDSGNRREFETGAVRDKKEGKGRMDLLPWGAILEVAKHSEKGSRVYGEHNVDKGIPLSSLCDSGARHLAKFIDGWEDEDHLLAATWNLLWAVQMRLKKPEMCDVPWKEAAK